MYFRAYARRSSSRLLCHVINVTHVVLETGHAPPESQRVSEARGALAIERRRHCAVRLYRLELVGREVPGRVELGYLAVQGSERFAQLWRGSLTADRDRPGVIQRVVVDSDPLPKTIVDESSAGTSTPDR